MYNVLSSQTSLFLINISVRWSIYCSGLFDKSQFLSFTFPLVSTSPSRGNDKHLLDHLSFSKSLKHKENCSFHTRDWYLYGMFSVVWIWDEYWFWWRRDLKFLSDVITVQPWKVLLRNYPRIQLRVLIWTITPTYMIKWLWGFSVKGLKQSAWLVSSQNFLVVSPFW